MCRIETVAGLFLAALLLVGLPNVAVAQTVELKIHHPLPVSSTVHQKVLLPWCEALQSQSNNRLQCRIFPAMQLGGNVPQLIDQVEDGVVDVNSGIELSAHIGSIFGQAELINRRLLPPPSIHVIADQEIGSWKKLGQPIIDGWVRDVTNSGADGKFLLHTARKLIADHEARAMTKR